MRKIKLFIKFIMCLVRGKHQYVHWTSMYLDYMVVNKTCQSCYHTKHNAYSFKEG